MSEECVPALSTNHFCTWHVAKVRLMVLPIQKGWEVVPILKVFHDESLNTPAYSYNCSKHIGSFLTAQNILKASPETLSTTTPNPSPRSLRLYVTILAHPAQMGIFLF